MSHAVLVRTLVLVGAFGLTLVHVLTGAGGVPLLTPLVVTALVGTVLFLAARDATTTPGTAFAVALGLYVLGAVLTAVLWAAAEGLLGAGSGRTLVLWPYDLMNVLAALLFA